MLFRPRASLQIPPGWQVVFNNLVELPPLETLTTEERDAYLSQDLLSLQSTAGHVIDVGWKPDGDPAGSYRLRVVTDSWSTIALRLDTRHVDVLRDAINLCALGLNGGVAIAEIQRQLDVRAAARV